MVPLIAQQEFTYARQRVRVGDLFDANPGDVTVLLALKRAVRAGPQSPRPPTPPQPATPPVEAPPAADDPNGNGDDDKADEVPPPVEDGVTERRGLAASLRRRTKTSRKVGR